MIELLKDFGIYLHNVKAIDENADAILVAYEIKNLDLDDLEMLLNLSIQDEEYELSEAIKRVIQFVS